MKHMKQIVRNISLFVEEQGAWVPAIVFLHYWGGTHRTWSSVIAALGASYHTVTYDMRGWGKSEPGSGYSISELADEATRHNRLLESLL